MAVPLKAAVPQAPAAVGVTGEAAAVAGAVEGEAPPAKPLTAKERNREKWLKGIEEKKEKQKAKKAAARAAAAESAIAIEAGFGAMGVGDEADADARAGRSSAARNAD